MLKINLVPDTTKKETGLKQTYSALRGMNYILIFLSILISAIFVSSQTFLIENSEQTRQNTDISKINKGSYNQKPREINERLQNLDNIIRDSYSNIDIIKNISTKVPDGISLSRLKINMEKKQIDMVGRANTRDTLLRLKDNMESDKFYTKINFPLQNILKKENIDFNISASINPKFLSEETETN